MFPINQKALSYLIKTNISLLLTHKIQSQKLTKTNKIWEIIELTVVTYPQQIRTSQ